MEILQYQPYFIYWIKTIKNFAKRTSINIFQNRVIASAKFFVTKSDGNLHNRLIDYVIF